MSSSDSRTSKSEENSGNASREMKNESIRKMCSLSEESEKKVNRYSDQNPIDDQLNIMINAAENLRSKKVPSQDCDVVMNSIISAADKIKNEQQESDTKYLQIITEKEEKIQELDDRNKVLQKNFEDLEETSECQKAEITKLQQQNAKLKEDIKAQERERSKLQSRFKMNKSNLEKAHKEEVVSKENLHQKAKEDMIKLHKADIEKLEKEHKESTENLNKIHKEDIEKLEEHNESTENLNKMYQERIDAIEKESSEMEKKFMELKKELADRQKEESMAPKFINKISGGTNFIGSSGSQVVDKTELEKLNYATTALSQKEDENKELQENVRQLNNQLSKKQFALGIATQKANELSHCNQRLQKRLEEEQNKSKELEKENNTLRNQNDNLKNEINALRNNDMENVAQQEEANEVNATVINF